MSNSVKIVILDDHPIVREGLKLLIEQEPDLEVVAQSGVAHEALELVAHHAPELLLLDIHMEGPTFNLVAQCKKVKPDLKILFITAFDTEANVRKVRSFGGDGLVSKLEGQKGICQAMREVLTGRGYFSTHHHPRPFEAPPPGSHPLSRREVDVICCVANAMTAREIAEQLHISVKTVDRHKANIMEKLHLRSQIELTRYAIRHGFVEV